MRLYLSGESQNKIGYIPDWLRFSFTRNGILQEITFDIVGEHDYEPNNLDCRCKGDLYPMLLWNCSDNEEIDFGEYSEEEIEAMFSPKEIVSMLKDGYDFRIGLITADDSEEVLSSVCSDTLTSCQATIEMYDGENEYKTTFSFVPENTSDAFGYDFSQTQTQP